MRLRHTWEAFEHYQLKKQEKFLKFLQRGIPVWQNPTSTFFLMITLLTSIFTFILHMYSILLTLYYFSNKFIKARTASLTCAVQNYEKRRRPDSLFVFSLVSCVLNRLIVDSLSRYKDLFILYHLFLLQKP